MVKRKVFTVEKCVVCQEPIEQAARGRPRLTCSDACRQARLRGRRGKPRKHFKKKARLVQKRRNRPFVERSFNKEFLEPVATLSYKRWVYECVACGEPYVVERISSGNKVRPFCSDACEQKTDYHWDKFEDALARAHMRGSKIDPKVYQRLNYLILSPLCPRCGTPFAPNREIFGDRKPGRPRKYCSDKCSKEAYEHHWKVKNKRARVHRRHECVECGTLFDRTDTIGRRIMRFCGKACSRRFHDRAKYARDKAKVNGRIITGHRAAYRSNSKNKKKRLFRYENAGDSSGGELENRRKAMKNA